MSTEIPSSGGAERAPDARDVQRETLEELRNLRAQVDQMRNEMNAMRTQLQLSERQVQQLDRARQFTSQPYAPRRTVDGRVSYPDMQNFSPAQSPNASRYYRRRETPWGVSARTSGYARGIAKRGVERNGYTPYSRSGNPESTGGVRTVYDKQAKAMIRQELTSQGWRDVSARSIASAKIELNNERRDAEARIKQERARNAEGLQNIQEWRTSRGLSGKFARQEQLRKVGKIMGPEFMKDYDGKPGPSASEIAFQQHVMRLGGKEALAATLKEGGTSAYFDRTQNNAVSSRANEILEEVPYDYNKYEKLDKRFANISDDAKALRTYHDRLKKQWNTLSPEERRHRASTLRTHHELFSKYARQHSTMEWQRNEGLYSKSPVLKTVDYKLDRASQHNPIRIALPFEQTENGLVRKEVLFYPDKGTVRPQDLILMGKYGISCELVSAGYKDGLGRESIDSVRVYLKAPGNYIVGNRAITILPQERNAFQRDEDGNYRPENTKAWDFKPSFTNSPKKPENIDTPNLPGDVFEKLGQIAMQHQWGEREVLTAMGFIASGVPMKIFEKGDITFTKDIAKQSISVLSNKTGKLIASITRDQKGKDKFMINKDNIEELMKKIG